MKKQVNVKFKIEKFTFVKFDNMVTIKGGGNDIGGGHDTHPKTNHPAPNPNLG